MDHIPRTGNDNQDVVKDQQQDIGNRIIRQTVKYL